jgi:integrase/recombinase XerD
MCKACFKNLPTTTTTMLEKFKNYIYQIGYSKGTQYQIPHCVKELLEQIVKPVQQIEQQDILVFYEYLQSRPLKRRTGALSEVMIHHYIFAIKVFFNWLEQTEQITQNPMSSLTFAKPNYRPREPLSQDEINQLFKATTTAKETAILHLFYSCGLRRTEAENLNTNDIHFTKNLLYVREGKGAKRRVIPVTEKVAFCLEKYYLKERPKVPLSFGEGRRGEVAFILNVNGNRMKGDQYNRILKQIVQRASLSFGEGREGEAKEISLHHLRHSIATHLLENGLSIEFVRDFLGHSHLETTQLYTKVFNKQIQNLQ